MARQLHCHWDMSVGLDNCTVFVGYVWSVTRQLIIWRLFKPAQHGTCRKIKLFLP